MLLDNGRTDALGRRGRPPGAALHPLLGLPERLPGLRAHRRPRLRLGLPRARSARSSRRCSSGVGHDEQATRCPTPRRCAAPATRCARSRSTSPAVLVHLRAQVVDAHAGARTRCRPWRRGAPAARSPRGAGPAWPGGSPGSASGSPAPHWSRPGRCARPAAVAPGDVARPGGGARTRPAVSARDEVLARVRSADDGAAAPVVPAAHPAPARGRSTCSSSGSRTTAPTSSAAPRRGQARVRAAVGGRSVVVPDGLGLSVPGALLDSGLGAAELDDVGAVLTTGCASASTKTGDHRARRRTGQGPRALTLVPDYHLSWCGPTRSSRVPDAVAPRPDPAAAPGSAARSATSDIELTASRASTARVSRT